MMSMIAGEETNLEEREVTMTVREREKTDAEMIGMRGKKERCAKLRGLSVIDSIHLNPVHFIMMELSNTL